MTRHPDPVIRRIYAGDRARRRLRRRAEAMVTLCLLTPGTERTPEIARLDNLVGEAERLVKAL